MSDRLPSVTSQLPRDLRAFLDRVRETLSGTGKGRFVTLDELTSGGVVATDPYGNIRPAAPQAYGTPPPPGNVTASAAIQNILIEWDLPQYPGHNYAEVWRAPTNNLGDAVLIGLTPGAIYVDSVGPSVTRYYWVRFVNLLGEAGPFNGVVGTSATTGSDVAYLLDTLTGQITETQLYNDLNSRIDLIDGPDTLPGSVDARVKVVNDIAVVKNRTYVAATAPSAPTYTLVSGDLWVDSDDSNKLYRWSGAAWVEVADSRIGALVVDFQEEVTTREEADLAEIRKREALYAGAFAGTGNNYKYFIQAAEPVGTQIGDIWSWVDPATGTVTFKRFNGTAWVDSAATQRAATYKGASANAPTTNLVIGDLYRDTDNNIVYVYNGSTWVVRAASVPDVAAFVESEQVARTTADTALASSITTLSSTVDGNTAAIQAEATTRAEETGDLFAKYGVKVDLAGHVSGYGLLSTANTGVAVDWEVIPTAVLSAAVNLPPHAAIFKEFFGGRMLGDANNDGSVTSVDASRFNEYRLGTLSPGPIYDYIAGPFQTILLSDPIKYAAYLIDAGPAVVSEFAIRADRFYVAPPATVSATAPTADLYKGRVWVDTSVSPVVTKYYDGVSAWVTTPVVLPFIVQASPTTINGVPVPAGVYIDTAFIRDGTITNAKIGNATIDNAKIVSLSADKITAGSIAVGQHIQSTGYVAGTSGWRINGNGNAEFQNIVARGTIYATAGEISGDLIAGTISANKISGGSLTGSSIQIPSSAGGNVFSVGFNGLVVGYRVLEGYNVSATNLADPNSPVFAGSTVTGSDASGFYGYANDQGHGLHGAHTNGASGLVGSGAGYDFYANGSTPNYGPFTGAHDALLPLDETPDIGDIMVDTGFCIKGGVSQVITEVRRSTAPQTPAAVGVLCGNNGLLANAYTPAALYLSPDDYYRLKDSYNYGVINSLGEGLVNVCGEGGDISVGDLIVTSSMPGKGMKQSDDIIRSYTVAKARENVSFSGSTEVKQVACIYLCG